MNNDELIKIIENKLRKEHGLIVDPEYVLEGRKMLSVTEEDVKIRSGDVYGDRLRDFRYAVGRIVPGAGYPQKFDEIIENIFLDLLHLCYDMKGAFDYYRDIQMLKRLKELFA